MSFGVLIVEKEERQGLNGLSEGLRSLGCVAQIARSHREVAALLNDWSPDAIVISDCDAGEGAFDRLHTIRCHPSLAYSTFFFASNRAAADETAIDDTHIISAKVLAHYFSLYACLKQILEAQKPELVSVRIELGCLKLEPQARLVTAGPHSKRIAGKEWELLEYLARRPDRAFTRQQLIQSVWPVDQYVSERTVDVLVMRLRKALGEVRVDNIIETVRAKGYCITKAVHAALPREAACQKQTPPSEMGGKVFSSPTPA